MLEIFCTTSNIKSWIYFQLHQIQKVEIFSTTQDYKLVSQTLYGNSKTFQGNKRNYYFTCTDKSKKFKQKNCRSANISALKQNEKFE